jgi:hypothetical protein
VPLGAPSPRARRGPAALRRAKEVGEEYESVDIEADARLSLGTPVFIRP